ncbi:MAG: hypothetical protein WC091_21880 [Sulfuricellaceae bacterium]
MSASPIDLANCSAQWLAEQDDAALEQAILACATWTPAIAAVLDNAFIMRTALLMPRSDAVNDLKSLDDLLGWADQTLPESLKEREIFRARWRALSETVRYRFYAIQQNPVKNLAGYKWVSEIIGYLGRCHPKSAPLAELLEQVCDADGEPIKPANLTRVLNIMEDNLLVARERSGKEKRVRLGEKAAHVIVKGYINTAPNPIGTVSCAQTDRPPGMAAMPSPFIAADAAVDRTVYHLSKTTPPAGILIGAYGR